MSERVQAVTDVAQAAYFRSHLQQDRSDLSVMLAKHTQPDAVHDRGQYAANK